MVKRLSNQSLDGILGILKKFPEGASLEEILENLTSPLAKRSIQRHIALLIQRGEVKGIGKGRARRYLLSAPSSKQVSYVISLSQEALAIQTEVLKPLQQRPSLGYNRDFLNQYHPNSTYYLSEKERSHLFAIGKSPDATRPAGTYAKHIFNRLLIDLAWNSSRLEGNTYSLLETERLIELGKMPEGKDDMEAQMILNHKAAIEFMIESAEHIQFDSFTILNLHALLSDNLLRDQRACGSLRSMPVGIAKSVYKPLEMPALINEYFQRILETANAIKDPFEQSFFVMVQLPYLQPFLDVNERVSRLAANIPLIRENLCPLSFVDVPEKLYVSGLLGVYELNRIELLKEIFLWAYERSSSLYSAARQEIGEPDPLRLHYREVIMTIVREIVQGGMDKQKAVEIVKNRVSTTVPLQDVAKLIEIVETELMSLHKGNIARFRLKPSEYDQWIATWS